MGADYTLQVKDHGNFAGEAAGVPGAQSIYGDFPEIYAPALDRLMPYGRLDSFQRHKVRAYGTYTQSMGRFGSVTSRRSGASTRAACTASRRRRRFRRRSSRANPGYPANDVNPAVARPCSSATGGQYFFKGYGVMDFAATYAIPVWKSASPWFKVEVYNVRNNQKQIAWDKTISITAANRAGRSTPTASR